MRKEELSSFCETELGRMDSFAEEILALTGAGRRFSSVETAATAAFLHYIYLAVENVLREVLIFDGIHEPSEGEIHQKILKTAGELGILTPDLYEPLSALLAFRSAFLQGQTERIDRDFLAPIVSGIDSFRKHFRTEVTEYLALVESE